jgi:superfamily II DNA or RNA helicase
MQGKGAELGGGIRLRTWQRAALKALSESTSPNFLAVATPGAGKTTFALAAARQALVARQIRRLVVVVPTQHLKLQWAMAAERFDIHLDPDWSARYGGLPSDVHGVAVTYQQVAANPDALRPLVKQAFVVLDEIHHAADTRAWGDAIRHAFEHAPRRLCMSGTPFRSDQSAIPFVRYQGEEAEADYEYGYADALGDRSVVRPVYFPRINGRMEWTAPDGSTWSAGFDDPLGRARASQRLRAALDLEGDWLSGVLDKAHRQLMHLRKQDPTAGAMAIAMDQDHARGIAQVLSRYVGAQVVVAISDDHDASKKIAEFAESDAPWIVAVRMVSEGVDIPRLRVGVYATHTVTDLFFRQAVGRLVRRTDTRHVQRAYMFIPDDPRLRQFAFGIAEQRRHSLRKPEKDDEAFSDDAAEPGEEAESPESQLSLFSVISSVPLEADGAPLQREQVIEEADGEIPGMVEETTTEDAEAAPFRLAAETFAEPVPEPEHEPEAPLKRLRSRKRELRERKSARVWMLVHTTGKAHADINAELNRRTGIRRITEATIGQLEKRLELADRWLTGRRRGRR